MDLSFMGLSLLDLAVIVFYLMLCVYVGIKAGGKPTDPTTYFKTDGKVPWWAVSFSIVATETSLLTVLSIPAVAYLGSFTFLQIVLGYIIGRFLVAYLILPSYFRGEQKTAYTFFKERFGTQYQRLISGVFLVTRLLADGVRLFAAAIPIQVITGLGYPVSIGIIALLTLAYTYYGGLKSVIWIDVLQLAVYTLGGVYIIIYVSTNMVDPLWPQLADAGKVTFIDWPETFSELFINQYNFIGAVIGGTFLSMASHGTDHLMVQRLLACKELHDAQKALIFSGLFVFMQFCLFLMVGMYIFGFYGGLSIDQLGLNRADDVLIKFSTEQLNFGMAGLIIAGLFAAAMSTLSSSLSALSSSTLFDLFPKLAEKDNAMTISRRLMILWTGVFFLFAASFTSQENPVIELGLAIAGFTYGGLLGSFLVGRYTQYLFKDAVAGLIFCITIMFTLINTTDIAWPWFTFLGVIFYFAFSTISYYLRKVINRKKVIKEEDV
ncbi:MAG: sodium:solute symporter [Balneolales bacterium]